METPCHKQDPEDLDPRPSGYSIAHFIAYAFLVCWFLFSYLLFRLLFDSRAEALLFTAINISGFLITRFIIRKRDSHERT